MNFVLLVFLSSVSVVDAPESEVIGSHEPVNATVGDDVILPCRLEPSVNVNTLTVEWTRNNNNNDKTFVHIFRHRKDYQELQDESFKGRTSLFHDKMARGNISLKLTNVTEQDEGNYTCFVPKLDSQVRRGFINLIVEPAGGRNKGNQTNNHIVPGGDTDTSQMSGGAITGITAAVVVAAIGLFAVLWLIVRQYMAEHRQEYNMAPRNE